MFPSWWLRLTILRLAPNNYLNLFLSLPQPSRFGRQTTLSGLPLEELRPHGLLLVGLLLVSLGPVVGVDYKIVRRKLAPEYLMWSAGFGPPRGVRQLAVNFSELEIPHRPTFQ